MDVREGFLLKSSCLGTTAFLVAADASSKTYIWIDNMVGSKSQLEK